MYAGHQFKVTTGVANGSLFCSCYNPAPMPNIQSIVADLTQERDRLSQAIAALESLVTDGSTPTTGRTSTGDKRIVSAVSRRRMAQAQRARWAKVKGQSKPATPKLTLIKRTMSPEAIEKIRRAKKKWWKARKAAS